MKTNHKILLGIAVLAIGYYIYSKNKKEETVTITTTKDVETGE